MRQAAPRPSVKVKSYVAVIVVNICVSLVLGNLHVIKNENHHDSHKTSGTSPHLVSREVLNGQVGNLMGRPGEGYYMEVEIGTPPQKLNVLIDTGSSNLAVACRPNQNVTTYFNNKKSTSYKEIGTKVEVPYTLGSWSGVLGRDLITLSTFPNSTVEAEIACINKANDFFINGSNWQGIMGLGYAAIARPDSSVEPFLDSFVRSGTIGDIFSVQLCGLDYTRRHVNNTVGGSMIFGGIVPSLYTGQLYSTPIVVEQYYEVVIIDILVGNTSLNMDCKEYNFDRTIVDTGTTNLRLPQRVFRKLISILKHSYEMAISGTSLSMPVAGFWDGNAALCWREGQTRYHYFPTVSLTLPSGDRKSFTLVVSPQQYIRPVGEELDDSIFDDCFKLGISSSNSGSVIGAVVMEGFYVVFDREARQMQFGVSTCKAVDDSSVKSNITGYNDHQGDYTDCAYKKTAHSTNTLTIVGYILAGICGICVLPLFILIVQWQCRKNYCRRYHRSNSDINDLMEGQN